MENHIHNNKIKGFTLVEMLIVIGLIALLATAVLVAVNPQRQFQFARDTERKAHLATILNAIGQNIAEHEGKLVCENVQVSLPNNPSLIKSGGEIGTFDLAHCIVPTYLAKMPFDPKDTLAGFDSTTSYYTGYTISEDSNGYMTLTAQSEINPSDEISVTR